MNSQSVEDIWKLLEQDTSDVSAGYLTRRIFPHVEYDIYLAITKPTNTRLLMLRVKNTFLEAGTIYPASKSFVVRRMIDQSDKEHTVLQLLLTDTKFSDIFTTLVQDLVDHLTSVPKERKGLDAFLIRLKRWQAFLERHAPEGLSESAQQGLYGEIWFLRQTAVFQLNLLSTVRAWTGPHGTQQDFQFARCAVEVKTTISKQHQKMAIASERQLDDTGTGILILLHLSLDARQGGGETLPAIVASVRSRLEASATSREEFENRLFEVGYLDSHASRYEQIGYTIRAMNYFKVEGDFPRIVEADLRSGIGDVRYTISVAECKRFAIAEADVLSIIGGQP